MSWKVTKNDTG